MHNITAKQNSINRNINMIYDKARNILSSHSKILSIYPIIRTKRINKITLPEAFTKLNTSCIMFVVSERQYAGFSLYWK